MSGYADSVIRAGRVRRRVIAAGVVALLTASCAPNPVPPPEPSPNTSGGQGIYVHATGTEPLGFDPAFATDPASEQLARQIFEGLVAPDEVGTGVQPALAEAWEHNDEHTEWVFTLREGVQFHDETAFTPSAVCANFDRWHRWRGRAARTAETYRAHFFRDGHELYHSCTRVDDRRVRITLTRPTPNLLEVLAQPQFAMQSPTALAEYRADADSATADPRASEYATAHPTGTGPFRFLAHEPLVQVVVERNPDYWGQPAELNKAVLRVVPDSKARLADLAAGRVNGFEVLQPADDADLAELAEKGSKPVVINRRQPSVLYVGFNQHNPMLADVRVRRAIALGINRQELLDGVILPTDTRPAHELIPPGMLGHAGIEAEEPDPELAKLRLTEAGYYGDDLTVKLAYPSGVTLPYLPAPEETYVVVAEQLEALGFTVQPVAASWPDYLDLISNPNRADEHDLHLMGWSSSSSHPANLLVPKFGAQNAEFGFVQPAISTTVNAAATDPGRDPQRTWADVSLRLDDFRAVVPLAYPQPHLVLDPEVRGYRPSPVAAETWNTVVVE
ncbi:ABC transporter substrate-binding protein [Enemella sp. A6]|uniref:ABC transporter substrate-binding protein n=1 Tax=Enemella sp. A6 TaxID=3440152 RepID=UPI003EB822B8